MNRIGNLLGEQNARRAKVAAEMSLVVAFIFAGINTYVRSRDFPSYSSFILTTELCAGLSCSCSGRIGDTFSTTMKASTIRLLYLDECTTLINLSRTLPLHRGDRNGRANHAIGRSVPST